MYLIKVMFCYPAVMTLGSRAILFTISFLHIYFNSLLCSPMLHLFYQNIVTYCSQIVIYSVWQSWIFICHYSSFSVTWSFRNHSNMMIGCSRNSSHYQCWKQLCCLMFLWKHDVFYQFLWWTKFKIKKIIWNIKYC